MDENHIHEFSRSVSKTGRFSLVSDTALDWARTLSDSNKIALYVQVRDDSERLESEWRHQFIELIEIPGNLLPQEASTVSEIENFVVWAKDHLDRGNVYDTLEEFLEGADSTQIRKARQLIIETGQSDLLEILDEYVDTDDWE